MMGTFLHATAVLFVTHLRRLVSSKRGLIMLLLALVPAVPVFILAEFRSRIDASQVFRTMSWYLLLQIVVPLLAIIVGSAVVAEEVADRTISYVFTRPIPRVALFIGRLCSSLVMVVGCVALAVLAMWFSARRNGQTGLAMPFSMLGDVAQVSIAGACVYCILFAAASTAFRHPMGVALGYTFAIEALLTNLPGSSGGLAIQYHLRCLLVGADRGHWTQISDIPGVKYDPPATSVSALIWVAVAAVALGALIISRKQYRVAS